MPDRLSGHNEDVHRGARGFVLEAKMRWESCQTHPILPPQLRTDGQPRQQWRLLNKVTLTPKKATTPNI